MGGSPSRGTRPAYLAVLSLPFFWGVLCLNVISAALVVFINLQRDSDLGLLGAFVVGYDFKLVWPGMVFLVVIVVVSALHSTLNSVLLSYFYFFYYAFALGQADYNGKRTSDDQQLDAPKQALTSVRRGIVFLYLGFFASAFILLLLDRPLFESLTSLGATIVVAAPWIFRLIVLRHWGARHTDGLADVSMTTGLFAANVLYVWSPLFDRFGPQGVIVFVATAIVYNFGVIAHYWGRKKIGRG